MHIPSLLLLSLAHLASSSLLCRSTSGDGQHDRRCIGDVPSAKECCFISGPRKDYTSEHAFLAVARDKCRTLIGVLDSGFLALDGPSDQWTGLCTTVYRENKAEGDIEGNLKYACKTHYDPTRAVANSCWN